MLPGVSSIRDSQSIRFAAEVFPQENTSHRAPVAELADAHDSGSCVRNGRGGSTPLRGKKLGLRTELFYWLNGNLSCFDCLGGSRSGPLLQMCSVVYDGLLGHSFNVVLIEPIEMVIIHLNVVVVLNLDAIFDPVRRNLSGHSCIEPFRFA